MSDQQGHKSRLELNGSDDLCFFSVGGGTHKDVAADVEGEARTDADKVKGFKGGLNKEVGGGEEEDADSDEEEVQGGGGGEAVRILFRGPSSHVRLLGFKCASNVFCIFFDYWKG